MVVITIENPWKYGVGLLGDIISILVFLAPVPTFYRICKRKSTESFDSTPYVVGLLSAMLWLYYAALLADGFVLAVNTAGAIIECVYIAIYLVYAPKKAKVFTVKLLFSLNVGLFGSMLVLTLLFSKGKKRLQIVGSICAIFAVSVFASPLSIIRLVIKTKSAEYMPFTLSLFLTLNAITWFCYGLILKDVYVALPNILGFLFGVVQMTLYVIYKNGKVEKKEARRLEKAMEVMPTATADPEIAAVENEKTIHHL